MNPADTAPVDPKSRLAITISIMIATVMISIDGTIANVAIPHMQGALSAAPDQITWVLTSYIVAGAILTPLTGWLTGRLGRKRLFLLSIGGFTVASMLCGAAMNLEEIVIFRLLQGAMGAAVIPLSQAVLLDIYPPEQHGQAMAMWGAGALLGPILGPVVGGYLTELSSWRWCFYINLPIGLVAMAGVWLFISSERPQQTKRFDFLGFSMLVLAVGAFQMVLDRGPGEDWFSSREIWIETLLALTGLWVFVAHTLTGKTPFFDRALLKDRNFLLGCLFGFLTGIMLFASMALMAPMLQVLMGYSVIDAGLVLAPRGIGSFLAMFVVGRLVGVVDTRLILTFALGVTLVSFWQMTHFDLAMGSTPIVISGLLQGLGMGLIFVPMTTLTFATIAPALRPEASSVYALIRNTGASVGIAIMAAQLTKNAQVMHESVASKVIMSDAVVRDTLPAMFNPGTAAGITALNAEISRQAMMVAYLNDFRLMAIVTVLCVPLALLMRLPRRSLSVEGPVHAAVD